MIGATGVPGPFEVLYEEDVFDIDLAEKLAHEALDGFRANPFREFFRLPLKIAVREVASIWGAIIQTARTGNAAFATIDKALGKQR
jgi:hypothetical protein